MHASPVPYQTLQRVKWTAEEDEILRQNVAKQGVNHWRDIAQHLPGRNGKQCRERWYNQLAPSLSTDDWAPHEDATLQRERRMYGNRWSRIAEFLPGRSANSIKNRWNWLCRREFSSPLAKRAVQPRAIAGPETNRGEVPALTDAQCGKPESSIIPEVKDSLPFLDPQEFEDDFEWMELKPKKGDDPLFECGTLKKAG